MKTFGTALPDLRTPPPGPRSRALAGELARYESRNITYLAEDFPVFWTEAAGANVRDAGDNVYVDLTSAFAVPGAGHSHPRIVEAVRAQAGKLMHGMGDVHPPEIKVRLLEKLAQVTPGGLDRTILANSGAEAIEAALKTSMLATGKPRVLAFHGAYHGLTLGALSVSSRRDFRAPFSAQLAPNAVFAPYPYSYRSQFYDDDEGGAALAYIEHVLDEPSSGTEGIGAILAEPVQGRGGSIVPPADWLPGLRRICDERGLLLILDEVYTGFGRTGRWFACEHWGVTPDLLVMGKALTGGFPFSACIGSERVMAAWPESTGEAIHTSTFLGNPMGCAAALAAMAVLEDEKLVERSATVGAALLESLRAKLGDHPNVGEVRGLGMMVGIELVEDRASKSRAPNLAARVMVEALQRGVLVLGGGIYGNVLSLSPPFVITDEQLEYAVDVVVEILSSTPSE